MNRYWLLALLVTIVTAACGATPDVDETPAPEATAQSTEPASNLETPAPTLVMAVTDDNPAPDREGYPPPESPAATADPYPVVEGFVWMIIPVGKQCADASENSYASLSGAVAALTAAGISVNASSMAELPVCTACGCPTSAHYQVQIEASKLNDALSLGWMQAEDQE